MIIFNLLQLSMEYLILTKLKQTRIKCLSAVITVKHHTNEMTLNYTNIKISNKKYNSTKICFGFLKNY
jgi:hypothetical protein